MGLPIQFFKHFCCAIYRLATKHSDWLKKAHRRIKNRVQFETVDGDLATGIAVRSAITATAEFLVYFYEYC